VQNTTSSRRPGGSPRFSTVPTTCTGNELDEAVAWGERTQAIAERLDDETAIHAATIQRRSHTHVAGCD